MGAARAYVAVLEAIERDVDKVLSSNHDIFSFKTTRTGFTEPRDFWSTGVIAFANGCRSAPGSEAISPSQWNDGFSGPSRGDR
jgi:hypothetical protein